MRKSAFRIHRESERREELFQIVTENAADMIALVDVKGNRLYNSPAYRRILGYSPAELGETSAFDQIHPDDRFKVLEAAREARSTGVGKELEYRIRHKDGSWRVLESIAGTIRNAKGEVTKLVIVNRDITDRKRAEQQAEHNSFHDGLTGLPNRRLFLDRLQQLFERAQRNPRDQYAILFVDLDGFKVFNDTMGPAAGDQILSRIRPSHRSRNSRRRVRWRVRKISPPLEMPFSPGWAEMNSPSCSRASPIPVTPCASRNAFCQGWLNHFRSRAEKCVSQRRNRHQRDHSCRAEDLLQDADVAMRRAKSLGGARCEVFDEAMHNRAVNRMKLEAELREAIALGQFRVHYQPIVQLASREIIGFEALLRWHRPDQGLISPHHFTAAAEDSGLLYTLGHWLILEACKQLQSWKVQHPAISVTISVNLSAKQFADARFVPELQAALRETGVEPSRCDWR